MKSAAPAKRKHMSGDVMAAQLNGSTNAVAIASSTRTRMLDGSIIQIEGKADLRIHPEFVTSVQASVGGRVVLFEAGMASIADHVQELLEIEKMDLVFDWQGGVLQMGSINKGGGPETLATWTGSKYAAKMSLAQATEDIVLDMMEQFDITETAEGIKIVSNRPGFSSLLTEEKQFEVTYSIEGRGLLIVQPLTKSRAKTLPDHEGAPVTGGELFKAEADRIDAVDTDRGEDHMHALLLISKTAVAHYLPGGPSETPQETIDLMAAITIDVEQE